MKLFKNKLVLLVLLGLLILIVMIPLVVFLKLAQQNERVSGGLTPGSVITRLPGGVTSWPVISRDVPAFASSGTAADADDDSYDTSWRSQGTPTWLAYDLSGVPASHRGKVLVVWYNESYNYDHTIINYYSYNMPQDYTISVNAGAGGGDPPDTGWVTLATVKGNHYHSRQHVIDMTGNNWVRLNVTAVDGAPENYDVSIKMDVYDTNYGTADDWTFFGDSITAFQKHQNLISNDDIHPTEMGSGAYRQQWANAMLAEVYTKV